MSTISKIYNLPIFNSANYLGIKQTVRNKLADDFNLQLFILGLGQSLQESQTIPTLLNLTAKKIRQIADSPLNYISFKKHFEGIEDPLRKAESFSLLLVAIRSLPQKTTNEKNIKGKMLVELIKEGQHWNTDEILVKFQLILDTLQDLDLPKAFKWGIIFLSRKLQFLSLEEQQYELVTQLIKSTELIKDISEAIQTLTGLVNVLEFLQSPEKRNFFANLIYDTQNLILNYSRDPWHMSNAKFKRPVNQLLGALLLKINRLSKKEQILLLDKIFQSNDRSDKEIHMFCSVALNNLSSDQWEKFYTIFKSIGNKYTAIFFTYLTKTLDKSSAHAFLLQILEMNLRQFNAQPQFDLTETFTILKFLPTDICIDHIIEIISVIKLRRGLFQEYIYSSILRLIEHFECDENKLLKIVSDLLILTTPFIGDFQYKRYVFFHFAMIHNLKSIEAKKQFIFQLVRFSIHCPNIYQIINDVMTAFLFTTSILNINGKNTIFTEDKYPIIEIFFTELNNCDLKKIRESDKEVVNPSRYIQESSLRSIRLFSLENRYKIWQEQLDLKSTNQKLNVSDIIDFLDILNHLPSDKRLMAYESLLAKFKSNQIKSHSCCEKFFSIVTSIDSVEEQLSFLLMTLKFMKHEDVLFFHEQVIIKEDLIDLLVIESKAVGGDMSLTILACLLKNLEYLKYPSMQGSNQLLPEEIFILIDHIMTSVVPIDFDGLRHCFFSLIRFLPYNNRLDFLKKMTLKESWNTIYFLPYFVQADRLKPNEVCLFLDHIELLDLQYNRKGDKKYLRNVGPEMFKLLSKDRQLSIIEKYLEEIDNETLNHLNFFNILKSLGSESVAFVPRIINNIIYKENFTEIILQVIDFLKLFSSEITYNLLLTALDALKKDQSKRNFLFSHILSAFVETSSFLNKDHQIKFLTEDFISLTCLFLERGEFSLQDLNFDYLGDEKEDFLEKLTFELDFIIVLQRSM